MVAESPLLAQGRHHACRFQCRLPGAKRTRLV